MKFEEHAKQRLDNWKGENEWNEWDAKKLITESQEELVDCYNYLNQLLLRHKSLNGIIAKSVSECKMIYERLEKLKQR
ncbi:hypothetical protein CMI37_39290 [Candidatus Pacearchaeota archaeon]|nr:hypothetical protein [Candidatus Pacearchaeota archaeon]|tara:strand:+ start:10539 stop:10772 length:234 start_codon:yes stop_codon:yes gene_type:complete